MIRIHKHFIAVLAILITTATLAQNAASEPENEKKDLRYNLNTSGSHFVKFTFLGQTWFRYNQSNPGTEVHGTPKDQTWDIGLRRTRMQLYGQITDRVFFYTQFGQNNLSYNGARKQGLFFLDALGEINVIPTHLSIGGGLTAWNGLSRYASPSIGSILSMDAPLYQQATNDVNDQFLRKLSIYAKGKLGKLDYRLALTNPMSLQTSTTLTIPTMNSRFSAEPGKMQTQGYFMYQFREQESNTLPYNVGSYLGKKDVFNVGAGFISQPDAMWHLSENGADTMRTNMTLLAVDVFYDHPLNTEKGTAVTAYGCFSHYDFGKNYLREVGVMNPATPVANSPSINGSGNGFPMVGTGNIVYAQAGYLLRKDLFNKMGTLQPYAAMQYASYEALADPMVMWEAGVNWLIAGNNAKLSLNVQNRPVFTANGSGDYKVTDHKNMVVLQLQVGI